MLSISSPPRWIDALCLQIAFGINALDGAADVNINLNLDANANVTAKLSKSFSGSEALTGCLGVGAGFSVNAVADGDFFDLFKQNYTVPLYSDSWNLWKVRHSPPVTRLYGVLMGCGLRRNASVAPAVSMRGIFLTCPSATASPASAAPPTAPRPLSLTRRFLLRRKSTAHRWLPDYTHSSLLRSIQANQTSSS